VKEFLTYARTKWKTKPRYVVLAGDGSFDYKNFKGLDDAHNDNLIPPMMANTPFGLFPADTWFVERPEASQAEIAIGRLPVTTTGELKEVIRKIVTRETAVADDASWLRKTLLVADDADDAGDFALSSEGVARALPVGTLVTRAYMPAGGGVEPARSLLLNGVNEGTGLISYIGHGGFDGLAGGFNGETYEGLFTTGDVAGLHNDLQPAVMTAMTCDAGNSALPGSPGIGESLVRQQGGGLVALWSASGWSENNLADPLAQGFYQALSSGGSPRIGDAINSTRRAYKANNLPWYMLSIYNLLGDPAMRVK
jgi:hypothetical protein